MSGSANPIELGPPIVALDLKQRDWLAMIERLSAFAYLVRIGQFGRIFQLAP